MTAGVINYPRRVLSEREKTVREALARVPASSGSGAPTDASYVVVGLNATLTNERKLTAGSGITLTDAGAGGNLTIASSAAANTGTTTVDFGAFPGSSDTSVAVTGQSGIVAGSIVQAFIRPVATADHTADEHWVEPISVCAGNIVAGTGFTIYAKNTNTVNEPLQPSAVSKFRSAATTVYGHSDYNTGGIGTRLYGLFTVAWTWV